MADSVGGTVHPAPSAEDIKKAREAEKHKKPRPRLQSVNVFDLLYSDENSKEAAEPWRATTRHSDCKVSSVTVYQSEHNAEVTRLVDVAINREGCGHVLITGVSPRVNPDSFRVSGQKGGIIVLGVTSEIEKSLCECSEVEERKKRLSEELKKLQDDIEVTRAERKIASMEAQYVCNFRETALKGASSGAIEEVAKKLSAFLEECRSSLQSLSDELTNLEDKESRLSNEINEVQAALNHCELINCDEGATRTVSIMSFVPKATKARLNFSYLIDGAHWSPCYDIRVSSKEKDMELTYYGTVKQDTGEDWNHARISLSTSHPMVGDVYPQLYPTKIEFVKDSGESVDAAGAGEGKGSASSLTTDERRHAHRIIPTHSSGSVKGGAEMPKKTSTAFVIPRPATILSGRSSSKVTIGVISLKAKFLYHIVPRKAQHAFLKVETKNTSDFPFISGPASVFLDGDFVCTGDMLDVAPQDNFETFVGSDDAVTVTYAPIKCTKEVSGYLTKVQSETVSCCTIIQNGKKFDIEVIAVDQLPKSQDEKVKVKVLDPDFSKQPHASLDPITNNINWKLCIPPTAQVSLKLSYVIDSPKDRDVVVGEI